VLVSIASGIAFVNWLGTKLGLPRRMTLLIAAGTSICGVTAITAVTKHPYNKFVHCSSSLLVIKITSD
jgi:uncharacterized membrane protein YadS